jgi:nitroimidazol reductase NimA-like FMN-containing flavoprotein (pyridoxamine 5'-phosphate oxidase superfamily)
MRVLEQDFDVDAFLQRPLFAHLATLGEEGPCESPVWFLWEDGALWFIAEQGSSYAKRLERDARAAVGIVDFDLERGFLQHVGMRGTAQVLPTDNERLRRFLRRYLGAESEWNAWFKQHVIDHQNLMVRFTPNTVVARDQSYFRRGDYNNRASRQSNNS